MPQRTDFRAAAGKDIIPDVAVGCSKCQDGLYWPRRAGSFFDIDGEPMLPNAAEGGESMENAARPKWVLTQEAFDGLLAHLGPDREAAADRYLETRRNLVRLFEWRGCPAPDEYADETINRCARKIAEGEEIRSVPTYCVGIARMLLLEMSRDRLNETRPLDDTAEPWIRPSEVDDDAERRLECLRRCLAELSVENRDLILTYYQGDKSDKIKNRKGLTQLFGLRASTLRMRALRLRDSLQQCSETCLQSRGGRSR